MPTDHDDAPTPPPAGPVLVVTAVAAERDAVLAGATRSTAGSRPGPATGADPAAGSGPATPAPTGPPGTTGRARLAVAAVGVGPAAAAAGTARLLALAEARGRPYRSVVSAGIAGAFPGRAPVGQLVLATRSVHADLGADSPGGFIPLDRLGFGSAVRPADPALLERLRAGLPSALTGDILTVSTATGTRQRAGTLAEAHPAAVAEAMEGYGVACAAADAGVPFAELRAVSNLVGDRERATWRTGEALAALTAAVAALGWSPGSGSGGA